MARKINIAISIVLILAIILPAPCGFALQTKSRSKSIAVVPVADGDMDAVSADASGAIAATLRADSGHHIIDSDLTAQVLDYHDEIQVQAADIREAEEALSRAKENFFQFRYEDAERELSRAISAMEARRDNLSGVGAALVDAYLTRAVIAKSRGDKKLAKGAIASALKINPKLDLEAQEYPPSLVAIYNEEAKVLASGATGTLSVKTTPEVADLYVNGIRMGVTPIEIESLPAGDYHLRIQANKYALIERVVSVSGGRQTEISEKLGWIKDKKGNIAQDSYAARQVGEALRIADVMKADKVVLVDVDDVGGGGVLLTSRMVDRSLRSGQAPIALSYKKGEGSEAKKLAAFTKKISDQAGRNLLSNARKNIDPEEIGDPVILEKRKKKFIGTPLFWVLIGGLAAGGLAGGLVAAFSGGGSGGPASLRVEFR